MSLERLIDRSVVTEIIRFQLCLTYTLIESNRILLPLAPVYPRTQRPNIIAADTQTCVNTLKPGYKPVTCLSAAIQTCAYVTRARPVKPILDCGNRNLLYKFVESNICESVTVACYINRDKI